MDFLIELNLHPAALSQPINKLPTEDEKMKTKVFALILVFASVATTSCGGGGGGGAAALSPQQQTNTYTAPVVVPVAKPATITVAEEHDGGNAIVTEQEEKEPATDSQTPPAKETAVVVKKPKPTVTVAVKPKPEPKQPEPKPEVEPLVVQPEEKTATITVAVKPEPVIPDPEPEVEVETATVTVAVKPEPVIPDPEKKVEPVVVQPSLLQSCNDGDIEVPCYDARDAVLTVFVDTMKKFPSPSATVTNAFILEAYAGNHASFVLDVVEKASGGALYGFAAANHSAGARRAIQNGWRRGVLVHANYYMFGTNGVSVALLKESDIVAFQSAGNSGVAVEEDPYFKRNTDILQRMDDAAREGYLYLVAGVNNRGGQLDGNSNHCQGRPTWCIATRWSHPEGGGTSAAVALMGGIFANVLAKIPATVSVHWAVDQVLNNATYVTLTPTVQQVKALNLLSIPAAVNAVRASLGLTEVDISAMQADIVFGSNRPAVPGTAEIHTVEGNFAFNGGEYRLSSMPLVVTHLAQIGKWSVGISTDHEKGILVKKDFFQIGYSQFGEDAFFGVRPRGKYSTIFRYSRWLAAVKSDTFTVKVSKVLGKGGNNHFSQKGEAIEAHIEFPIALSKKSTLTVMGSVGKFGGGTLRTANATSNMRSAGDYRLRLIFSHNW